MNCLLKYGFIFLIQLFCSGNLPAQQFVSDKPGADFVDICSKAGAATIYVDDNDFAVVKKASVLLQQDIESVTGIRPDIKGNILPAKTGIIIGSIERSSLIRQLVQRKKIDVANIKGHWEAYQVQMVQHPFAGMQQALVITGNNRRGVAYGIFELSKQIGVSPWYWWADVPAKKREAIYIKKNLFISDEPKVKYRGIFINDEAPALSGWTKEKFGGFNHLFYEKVFELILRLKGNYLWPAMWGNAFYDDDLLNIKAADDYGVVIGTSHHEPLMRAHVEWKRYGTGPWNYDSNEVKLKKFWEEGMHRATNEKIVSIGMRGDGDEPMTRETATALLERIVADQRKIITDVTHKPASETPQSWALYKEVQDYYDKGMRVPDDVTLLLCDDNWGNIRRLPKPGDKPRKGGYGIYYHFDYVGDPRNYKWLNTNNISRTWEQMNLAWEYNARQIWIVNVGDIKPMEYPISFFLDQAWDPEKMTIDKLTTYSEQWAAEQFGSTYAKDIGDILTKYSSYNARRKPELLDAETYSIEHYDEADRVTHDWLMLLKKTEEINSKLPAVCKDAYFQLVLHPVKACANLQQLYTAVARNKYFAARQNAIANVYADKAKAFYKNDSMLTIQYHAIANGKWNHMMDQTHIGYTYWQQPPNNSIPAVTYVSTGASLPQNSVSVSASQVAKNTQPANSKQNVFYENDGYVSMLAGNYTKAINGTDAQWKVIPGIGREGDGITTFPVTMAPKDRELSLRFEFTCNDSGAVKIYAFFSPTLNFLNGGGLRYSIAIDDEQPQSIAINKDDDDKPTWEKWVANNIIIKTTEHHLLKPGKHTIHYSVLDPGIVLQKIVIDFGGVKQSYLGPPETLMNGE
ncbi:glycosyl hydrolase 115 family protein [Danxiaibacter flavus]|uniref:Glycosyl hydrolase 115 family protein n=1 Tax=Danxiaibacter flavus TaxID=3049108 RepID=A0ABV3ZH96_9BACT|nr:glycosyl hydrolase 115 family protein [Chitinophagaceae bacterium DXS]